MRIFISTNDTTGYEYEGNADAFNSLADQQAFIDYGTTIGETITFTYR